MTTNFNLLSKIKKKLFGNAYSSLYESQFTLSLARAFSQVLQSQKKKSQLITAYTDINLYGLSESLSDLGFTWENSLHTFFGGDSKDQLHPYNPLSDLKKFKFDIVLGPAGIDLIYFAKSVKQALKEIKSAHFKTCLNSHKLFILAALICLIPNDSTILEVGSYQCGTTIFMAQLCKALRKKIKIYACDTFCGIPSASVQDRADPIFYDSGMFIDNPIEQVQKRIKSQNLERYIELVKGDVVNTLPNLALNDLSLVFLDTDQYRGTKSGLDIIAKLESKPHIIIDDTSLSSVSLAIDEFLQQCPQFARKNLVTNFDYLVPQIV